MTTAARVALLTLATARLTRLVVSDTLPEYLVIGRLRNEAQRAEERYRARRREHFAVLSARVRTENATEAERWEARRLLGALESTAPMSWAQRLMKGVDCPYCVGFWIGGAVLVGEAVTRRAPSPLRALWTTTLAALALNYVTAHAVAKLDS